MNCKRFSALLLSLLLCASCALADTDLSACSVTSAHVTAVRFVDVTAPCSGTLESFDLQSGDTVAADQTLFTLLTTPVYAPESGTVKAVYAQTGEDASWAASTYGAAIVIEPDLAQTVSCTVNGAYNDEENRTLHVGETLYFQSAKSSKTRGTGRVTAVSGDSYTVYILTGTFDRGESLTMYRDSGYNNRDCVGKGVVARRASVSVKASGITASVAVTAGTHVNRGDLLMTVLSSDAAVNTLPEVKAGAAGVVASVAVTSGQQVWRGELLCRIDLTDELEITANVDEVDLHGLAVGDKVKVTLDTDESKVLDGTVSEISALGVTSQNAALYTVHVSLASREQLMLGQSASLYLPKE